MTSDASDLSTLFAPPPPGPAQAVTYRQGVVQSFDQNTLHNTVLIGGTVLTDLPILGVGESTLLRPGSVVGVMNIAAAEGAQTWAIIGRLVIPNTADAFDAIALMSADTAVDYNVAPGATSNDVYEQPTNRGPTVTVNVRNTGRVLMLLGTLFNYSPSGVSAAGGGAISVELTGANTVAASDAWSAESSSNISAGGATINELINNRFATVHLFEGLSPGPTTFDVRTKAIYAGVQCTFTNTTLAVIVL